VGATAAVDEEIEMDCGTVGRAVVVVVAEDGTATVVDVAVAVVVIANVANGVGVVGVPQMH
jgi:hypothetical protein